MSFLFLVHFCYILGLLWEASIAVIAYTGVWLYRVQGRQIVLTSDLTLARTTLHSSFILARKFLKSDVTTAWRRAFIIELSSSTDKNHWISLLSSYRKSLTAVKKKRVWHSTFTGIWYVHRLKHSEIDIATLRPTNSFARSRWRAFLPWGIRPVCKPFNFIDSELRELSRTEAVRQYVTFSDENTYLSFSMDLRQTHIPIINYDCDSTLHSPPRSTFTIKLTNVNELADFRIHKRPWKYSVYLIYRNRYRSMYIYTVRSTRVLERSATRLDSYPCTIHSLLRGHIRSQTFRELLHGARSTNEVE